jgi:hypothetical protein
MKRHGGYRIVVSHPACINLKLEKPCLFLRVTTPVPSLEGEGVNFSIGPHIFGIKKVNFVSVTFPFA